MSLVGDQRPSNRSDHLTKLLIAGLVSRLPVGLERGENMNLIASLAALAVSVALLFFGRGRGGEGHPIFQKSPWVVGQLFGMAILYLFFAGLMGVAANLNWLG
jgi:hypothetical protein